jgi:putative urate catabolism protein
VHRSAASTTRRWTASSARDLVGYGAEPPDPRWPDGARLALSFVLNYEEGGENTPLEGDPAAEAYLHEVVGAPAAVGRRDLNVESMFEFGSRAGFWRVHRIFRRHGLPLTVYAVGQALERNPDAARAMVGAGWEVASHGWRWIDYADMAEEDEREHMRLAVAAIERACGVRPVGWYTGRTSERTRRLVVEDGGFLYDSDSYADELPYWVEVGGRSHLVIPYTLDANDFKFLLPNGFVTADDFAGYLIDTLEQLHGEGGRLMNVGLHCRIVGRPGRAPGLERFLRHVTGKEGVWVATREQIARHWRSQHPPKEPS